ncbi:MAG: molybdopterin-dependent oxidoreductase [Candidatus Bathyarchaeota archaeon]
MNSEDDQKGEWRYGGCHACFGAPCPARAKVVNGRVVKVEAQKMPLLNGLCAKGHATIDQLYGPDRLKYPMRRVGKKGEGKFKRISWDEALTEIATVLKKYRAEGHPEYVAMVYGCGGWGNRALYNYFRTVYGTPNFSHHHGDTCNASCAAAAEITGGSFHGELGIPEYCNSRYILEVSHNPLGGANAPIHESVRTFNEAMRNGTKIVVVDPRLSETAAIPGAEWIPIKPGTDAAFFLGLIHVLIAEKLYNEDFLLKHTNGPILIQPDGDPLKDEEENFLVWDTDVGDLRPLNDSRKPALFGTYDVTSGANKIVCSSAFQLLARRAEQYTPIMVEEITTIPSEKITQIAKEIGAAKPSVATNWNAPRSCFYTNSMQTWRLRYILGMLLGSYDVPGGMICEKLAGFQLAKPPTKPTKPITAPSIENDTDAFSYPYSDAITKFTRQAILEGMPYPIKAMIVYAHSLLNSHTNPQEYRRALEKEDLFLVVIDIWPNDHIDYADIVLPDASCLERLQIGSSVWANKMKVVGGLLPIVGPLYDTRDVSDIYIELAEKLGLGEYFNFTKEEWFNAQLEPLGIDVDYLKKHGVYYELTDPIYYRFPYKVKPETSTGRLEIYATSPSVLELFKKTGDPHADPLPDHIPLDIGEPKAENEFYLLSAKHTIHQKSTSQDNAYLMEDYIDGLDFTRLWINADKAFKLGIENGDLVKIWSEATGAEGLVRVRVMEGIHPSAVFAFTGFGHKAKMMTIEKGKEGINVNEFVPDHIELVSGAAATQEAIIKVEKVGR